MYLSKSVNLYVLVDRYLIGRYLFLYNKVLIKDPMNMMTKGGYIVYIFD